MDAVITFTVYSAVGSHHLKLPSQLILPFIGLEHFGCPAGAFRKFVVGVKRQK